jgi:hypothetical protein
MFSTIFVKNYSMRENGKSGKGINASRNGKIKCGKGNA